MARTNTIPQAPKVDYRNIVCSGHAGKVWRKQRTRDFNVRNRGKVKDFEWTLDELADQERAVDFDMAQQVGNFFLGEPIDEVPVLTLFDEIELDSIDDNGNPREYLDGLDEDEEPMTDYLDDTYYYDTRSDNKPQDVAYNHKEPVFEDELRQLRSEQWSKPQQRRPMSREDYRDRALGRTNLGLWRPRVG